VQDTHISIPTQSQALKRDIPTAGKKRQVGKTSLNVELSREGQRVMPSQLKLPPGEPRLSGMNDGYLTANKYLLGKS